MHKFIQLLHILLLELLAQLQVQDKVANYAYYTLVLINNYMAICTVFINKIMYKS